MAVRFGITFLPNAPADFVEWCRTAEACGFDIVGIADSQSLYREVTVSCTLCALNTERIRFGPRVINPLTRHPAVTASAAATLAELAPGRTMLGLGTGDSAVYNIGLTGATHAELREYLAALRGLLADGSAEYHGRPARLSWGRAEVPLYIAASGPRTLRLAGEIADGVVINTGLLPEVIRDSIDRVREGAEAAGRDPAEIDLWWLPLTNLADDRRAAIGEIAMSLASAGSHLSRFTTAGKHIPPELLERVRALGAGYHFDQHSKPDSANRGLIEELGLVDYLADRFAVAGPPAECICKLERAVEAGATQFWMSVHFDDKLRFMHDWAERVMPAFR
jgi:5,10-methylenetetrahydromethanopterin reductase